MATSFKYCPNCSYRLRPGLTPGSPLQDRPPPSFAQRLVALGGYLGFAAILLLVVLAGFRLFARPDVATEAPSRFLRARDGDCLALDGDSFREIPSGEVLWGMYLEEAYETDDRPWLVLCADQPANGPFIPGEQVVQASTGAIAEVLEAPLGENEMLIIPLAGSAPFSDRLEIRGTESGQRCMPAEGGVSRVGAAAGHGTDDDRPVLVHARGLLGAFEPREQVVQEQGEARAIGIVIALPTAARDELRLSQLAGDFDDVHAIVGQESGARCMPSDVSRVGEPPPPRVSTYYVDDSFRLAIHEVTNDQYFGFLKAWASRAGRPVPTWLFPPAWSTDSGDPDVKWIYERDRGDYPVTQIPFAAARLFCAWFWEAELGADPDRIVDLPTAFEYLRAARGDELEYSFPWGPGFPDDARVNLGGQPLPVDDERVGEYGGVFALVGNVAEWVHGYGPSHAPMAAGWSYLNAEFKRLWDDAERQGRRVDRRIPFGRHGFVRRDFGVRQQDVGFRIAIRAAPAYPEFRFQIPEGPVRLGLPPVGLIPPLVDPLEKLLGGALTEPVEIHWANLSLRDVAARLEERYGVPVHLHPELREPAGGFTIEGRTTFNAVLGQLETALDARTEVYGDDAIRIVPLETEAPGAAAPEVRDDPVTFEPRQREVALPVHLARTEITNRQYLAFLADVAPRLAPGAIERELLPSAWRAARTAHPFRFPWGEEYWADAVFGGHWGDPNRIPLVYPPGEENRPVQGVTIAQVEAYAAWLGGKLGRRCRIPTVAEFVRAGRESGDAPYPPGIDADSAFLVCSGGLHDLGRPISMAGLPGAEREPLLGLVGNLLEYVRDARQGDRLLLAGGFYQFPATLCTLDCFLDARWRKFSFVVEEEMEDPDAVPAGPFAPSDYAGFRLVVEPPLPR